MSSGQFIDSVEDYDTVSIDYIYIINQKRGTIPQIEVQTIISCSNAFSIVLQDSEYDYDPNSDSDYCTDDGDGLDTCICQLPFFDLLTPEQEEETLDWLREQVKTNFKILKLEALYTVFCLIIAKR